MTAPKARGVLFMDAMVRAILEGRKTVTRRVGPTWARPRPGDRLWVREAWASANPEHPKVRVCYRADGMSFGRYQDEDGWHCAFPETLGIGVPSVKRWRPSIHMPRWACRLELEVVSVTEQYGLAGIVLQEDPGPDLAGFIGTSAIDDEEGRREGFADAAAFRAVWRSMHADHMGPVYRVEFRRTP